MDNVRYWHLADMGQCTAHVRFLTQSGRGASNCGAALPPNRERVQDLERVMLQFAVHFCRHQLFAFADLQVLRQVSWHDFFCAKAGADANSKLSAATIDKTFIMLSPPKALRKAYRAVTAEAMSQPEGAPFFIRW